MAAQEEEATHTAKKAKLSSSAAAPSDWIDKEVPDVHIDLGFGNPRNVGLRERCADKKVVLVGLPGAFTPT